LILRFPVPPFETVRSVASVSAATGSGTAQ
jgi:hypothetical protein